MVCIDEGLVLFNLGKKETYYKDKRDLLQR
jgi:hypothetical protein